MNKNYVIGIDLGGTKISGALGDLNGKLLSQYTLPTNSHEGEEAILNRIFLIIDKVMEEANKSAGEIKSIGIGSPGPLDSQKGMILTSPNLPFRNFNLVEPLINRYNIPTILDNDANVATMGEFMLGAGKGTKNMIYITVSTGVGGGAIIDGKIYRGNTSNALEVGHMTVLPDGPKCNCGNYGCVEALASGTAIARQANDAIKAGLPTSLKKYNVITSYEVFKEANDGDKIASDIIENSMNYLGIGIANLITVLDPEMVVIGGGVSKGGSIVFDKVREVVNKRCFKIMAEICKIVPASLGTDAGVVGAVALALLYEG